MGLNSIEVSGIAPLVPETPHDRHLIRDLERFSLVTFRNMLKRKNPSDWEDDWYAKDKRRGFEFLENIRDNAFSALASREKHAGNFVFLSETEQEAERLVDYAFRGELQVAGVGAMETKVEILAHVDEWLTKAQQGEVELSGPGVEVVEKLLNFAFGSDSWYRPRYSFG